MFIPSYNHQGFTLLEISVVMVILGLIIGGLTVGQSLIRSAELNSVLSDFQKYQTAIDTFQEKYKSLPGDISNATDIWPTSSNGNENGLIDGTAIGLGTELSGAWQHLSLAGLINGTYSGSITCMMGTCTTELGVTNPKSEINGAGYFFYNTGTQGYLILGGLVANQVYLGNGVLLGSEGSLLDEKIDDGIPDEGRLTALNEFSGGGTSCVTGSNYNLSSDDEDCLMLYRY